jgi:hypothetical protein
VDEARKLVPVPQDRGSHETVQQLGSPSGDLLSSLSSCFRFNIIFRQ